MPLSRKSAAAEQSPVVPLDTIQINIENTLKHKGKWEEFLIKLGTCQNDFKRLKLVLDTEEVGDHITQQTVCQVKSTEQAERLRTTGNQYFKSAQYDEALNCYSEAVRYAPHPSPDNKSTVLAMCFGNRSAAFFHLKQFHSCLEDIDNAVHAGYPAGSMHKLLDRKGKCHLFLKHKAAAIEAFQEAKQALLSDASLQEKTRQDLSHLTEQFIFKCKNLVEGPADKTDKTDHLLHESVPVLTETNPQILCATNFLTIKNCEGRGRGLYATRDIKVGEVLIVEKPYTSVVLTDHSLTHCHHCCVRCLVPLPCERCVDVVFCSSRCRQEALKDNHSVECQLMNIFHKADVRLGHLAFKMVAKAGFSYLMEQRDSLEHPGEMVNLWGFDEKGTYDSENYSTMYHLVGHGNQRKVEDIWPRTVHAAFLLKCLEQTNFFPPMEDGKVAEGKRQEDICYIGSHILRHLMMLPCNAHEVSEMAVNWQEPSQSQTLEIGSAIYPVLSLINHSCDPSVVRHSYANVCVVRAIRGIVEGEELFDNYGALYPVMDKPARLAHLENQYYFSCSCEACIKNWPTYMEIPKDVMHFYCERCRGMVPVPSILQASKIESMECMDCGHQQNIRSVILKVGSLEQGFQDALHKVIFRLDVEGDTLPRLVQFLRVVDKYVHRPVSCHNDCQEAIKMCYAYKANAYPRKKVQAGKHHK